MSYIAAEDVAKAKEMDLLTFLRNYEPQELVHVSVDTYAPERMILCESATGSGAGFHRVSEADRRWIILSR